MKKDKKKEPELPPAPSISADDAAFEAEIMKRHPTRKRILRFDFPPDISEARVVYMFEQKAKDELTAADMADATMTDLERKSMQRALDAERREGIRLTIAGIILADEGTGELERRHIDQSAPFMEIDDWSSRAWAALRTFFGELNGLPMEDLGNAVRGARKLGAASPANPAEPARVATAT